MEITNETNIQTVIAQSLDKSMSYTNYRALVHKLADENSNTGNDKNEALANYTMLNDRRMKRWDKTVKVSDVIKNKVEAKKLNQTWVVLTESWCGDAAHVMPVFNKIAELNSGIDFKVVLRDENEALMDRFLTNGGRSIPKLIVFDNDTNNVVASYGPRPSTATDLVNAYKERHGSLTPEFKEELQHWYNKDKGQTALRDLMSII